jgi:hypothetical protein
MWRSSPGQAGLPRQVSSFEKRGEATTPSVVCSADRHADDCLQLEIRDRREVESIRPWSATMAESRPAPALSARDRGVQKSHGWLGLAAIGKSPAPETPKASDNRDHPLFAVRSAVALTTGQVARSYWGVENGLHWVLNAHHAAGQNEKSQDNGACNLAILRHMALNLPQRDRPRVSLRSKFYIALGRTTS